MNKLRIEYVENGDQSTYRLVSANNKVMLTSETYSTPRGARRAAEKTGEALELPVVASGVRYGSPDE